MLNIDIKLYSAREIINPQNKYMYSSFNISKERLSSARIRITTYRTHPKTAT